MTDFAVIARQLGLDREVIAEALRVPEIRAAIEEQARRKIEEPYRVYQPQAYQLPFHRSTAKVRAISGGNRSAKTISGAMEAIWWATGDHPFRKVPLPNHGIVVSEDSHVLHGVQLPYFFTLLPANGFAWSEKWRTITITKGAGKGSTIEFKSVDSGWAKFQGFKKHWAWFDEEPDDERVYNETMRGLVDYDAPHWVTWTPMRGLTWLYYRVWRNQGNIASLERFRFKSEDNKYISAEVLKEQFAGMSEDEQRVRLYGDFVALGGRPIFNREILAWHAQHVKPGRTGDLRWSDDEHASASFKPRALNRKKDAGYLEIWQNPQTHHDYVVGSDHAEGRLFGDATDAYVKDRHTGRQVAEWHGRLDAGDFAEALMKLGYFYNTALLDPERNSVGLVVIDRLKGASYPRVYAERVREGTRTEGERSFGFLTTEKSKRTAIELLRMQLKKKTPGYIRSARRLAELQNYEYDDRGRMGAAAGCNDEHDPACHEGHDDTVASLWCAEVADNDEPAPEALPGASAEEELAPEALWAVERLAEWRAKEREKKELADAIAEEEDADYYAET